MSQQSLSSVIKELFSSPLEAVCEAEKRYLKIWASWIRRTAKLYNADGELTQEEIQQILSLAPVVSLEGAIEMAITLRVSELKQQSGEIDAGIQVGPIYASGSYGFSSERFSESLLQANTRFTVSNQRTNLSEYLKEMNLMPTSATDLGQLPNKLTALIEAEEDGQEE